MSRTEHIGLSTVLLVVLIGLVGINQYLIGTVTTAAISTVSPASSSSASSGSSASLSNGVLPTGVPAIYGAELGVSYDDVGVTNAARANAAIQKLGVYDTSITLSGDALQRYIATASQISCEYCCGAESIIFKNGQAACGCAHSAAMRGLAKYLLTKHPTEFTNDQILEEMGKWKTLFFPSNMMAKADVLKQKGIEFNYINLASNKYRGIEKGATAGSSMVGGC